MHGLVHAGGSSVLEVCREWYVVGYRGASWDIVGRRGTSWDAWDVVERRGTSWDIVVDSTNN